MSPADGAGQPPAYDPHAATTMVGGYRLLRVVGEGGMGVVHLGLDSSGRAAAVKVLRPHVAADPEARARLAREVRTLVRVKHRRVAEVIDAGLEDPLPYIAMRYVPGNPLDAVVREHGALRGAVLDELLVGLFEAVSAIHGAGVVHRDLKPGNVLLLDGSPVVIDFGIARALDDVSLTSTGLMVGTPGYLAPEVLDGGDVGTAADWWGWGAVAAFAATGRPVFGRGPMEAVFDRVRRGQADLDGMDPGLARLIAATLRPDPAARPPADVLAAGIAELTGRRPESLRSTVEDTPVVPVPPARADPRAAGVPAAEARAAGARAPEARAPDTREVRAVPPLPAERTAVLPVVRPPSPAARERVGSSTEARYLDAMEPARSPEVAQPTRPSSAPVGSLPVRGWLTALGALTLVAVAVVTGEGAAVIALSWASAARATQWTRVAAARRRWRAGRLSASAATGLAVAYPVRLVGALLASVGFAAVALLVISPVLLIVAAVLLQGVPLSDLGLVRDTLLVAPVRSGLAVLLGLALWAGPGGRAVRDGSRALTDRAAGSPRGAVALAATCGLVVVSAVVVLLDRGPLT